MNKIRIALAYRGYPVWVFDDQDNLIINDLPLELASDKEIDESFLELQRTYDSLYQCKDSVPEYIGFKSEADLQYFQQLIDNALNLIKMKTGPLYHIELGFDMKDLQLGDTQSRMKSG